MSNGEPGRNTGGSLMSREDEQRVRGRDTGEIGLETEQLTMPTLPRVRRGPERTSPRLVMLEGEPIGRVFRVVEGRTTVGRDEGSTIVLGEVGVSRHHAILVRRDGRVVIEDQGSRNGTYVNEERIEQAELRDGDLLFLGAATLKFVASSSPELDFYQQLHDASSSDALTGARNRRTLDRVLERYFRTRDAHGSGSRPLALLLLDLDHFKAINDRHGHLCGDTVLRGVARVVDGTLREGDLLARYGGEEFVVVLPGTGLSGATALADRIRRAVEAATFEHEGIRCRITVSIGVASRHEGPTDPQSLIALADDRLYTAKGRGRNRVVAL